MTRKISDIQELNAIYCTQNVSEDTKISITVGLLREFHSLAQEDYKESIDPWQN